MLSTNKIWRGGGRFSIGDVEKVDLSVNKYLLYDSWGYTVHITQGYMVSRVKFNVQ